MRTLRQLTIAVCLGVASSNVHAQTASTFSEAYSGYRQAIEQSNGEQAVDYAKQALSLASESILADADNYFALQYNLANAFRLNQELDKAEEAYESLAQFAADKFGSVHLNTFLARLERYDVLEIKAKSALANTSIRKAKTLYKDILYDLDDVPDAPLPNAALIYYNMLSPITRTGQTPLTFSRTEALASKALNLANEAWGSQDIRSIHLSFLLGKIHFSRRDYEAATTHFESVASRVDEALIYTHPWALKAHAMLVQAYSELGEKGKATAHCQTIGKMTPWDDNQEPDPIYRVNPTYPRSAAIAGREGFVVVEFEIDEQGFVNSPDVLAYEGSKKFIRSTLDAIEQWRYAPKFSEGEPVVAQNQKVRLDFKLSR